MEQNKQNVEQKKQPKTWDQAFSELKSFIIQSKKEEAENRKKQAENRKEELEQ